MLFLARTQCSGGRQVIALLFIADNMHTKQTIAIIGASGSMGSAIAKSLAKGNYRLLLDSKNVARLNELVTEIMTGVPNADLEITSCSMNAGWEADIIVVAVPYNSEKEIAEKIREVANQKIVISISNPLNGTYDGLLTELHTSAAEELQKMLPNSKVIKAFNTNFAANFNSPIIDGSQVDSFLAGDDAVALSTVSQLVETAGFNPIVAGGLVVSRTLENMQLLLIQLGLKYNYNRHAGWKIIHHQIK